MKLTPDMIESAAQFTNKATRDRELDLRGFKVTVIENLGATLDQFDCIDFSDNDIRRLDGFPLLPRIKKLLLNNNRVSRIADHLEESLPHIHTLILTNNDLQELGDINSLATLDKLECLSLLNNPITTKKYYRHYIIHKIPQVKLLDFRRIRMKERQEAEKLFKGAKGKLLEKEIGIKSKAMGGGVEDEMVEKERERLGGGKRVLAPADVDAIKAAISKAQTLEEIERLNQLLKSGYIPGKNDSIGETKEMDVSMEENIEENRNGRGE